jgi:RND family efflux transporter MFP subunit
MNGRTAVYLAGAVLLAACTPKRSETTHDAQAPGVDGTPVAVVDTVVDAMLDAAGVAEPFQQATLSTKLMGTVVAVLVREGDIVSRGQPLVRIDARDLVAKEAQVAASVADAEASRREALAQAMRIRSLYADSAATKAQLDAAETGLARADAGARAASASAAELVAVSQYATVRAPFAGVVTQRFVDPGAFAAPGAPLVAVQDVARLRIAANATPDAVRSLRRGASIGASIEGRPVNAVVEGVVPAAAGNMYTVNAIVSNPGRALLAGSTASLALPLGRRPALLIPSAALRRDGDLTGVMVRTPAGDELRWVRLGRVDDGVAEVTSGLRRGDQVVVPTPVPSADVGAVERRN